jgi:hypothetical protein
MAATISRAVGKGVSNEHASDVMLVQKLLNRHRKPPLKMIEENGKTDQQTIAAIQEFQSRVVKMKNPDGRVDPGGATIRLLSEGATNIAFQLPLPPSTSQYFNHPGADKVSLSYGPNAVVLNAEAAHLMKSILAAAGMTAGNLTSTLRTYHDQARITITQTYAKNPDTVKIWYGAEVLKACKEHLKDIQGFADWWKAYDTKRGKVSSKHLTNRAMDVVPNGDRLQFVKKVKALVATAGSGVHRIIPKGELNEPVDHVEFTFDVT